jgi:hypothetical protein
MHGGGPYMVKAVARRLNGGGPFMVVVHMWWGKTSQNGKTVPGGKNYTGGGKCYQWTKCRSVDNMSHCGKCVTHG